MYWIIFRQNIEVKKYIPEVALKLIDILSDPICIKNLNVSFMYTF